MPCEVLNKLTFPVAELPCLRAKPNSVWTSWIPDSVFVSFSSFSWPNPHQCQPSVSPFSLCRCAVQRSDGRHCLPTRLNLLNNPWEQGHLGSDAGWKGFLWVGEATFWEDKWEHISWVRGRVKKEPSCFKALVTINWNIWVKNKNTEIKKVKVGSRKLRKNIASLIGLNSHVQYLLLYHNQWQIISVDLKMKAHPSLGWENGISGVGQVCVTCVAFCSSPAHGHVRVKLLVSYVMFCSVCGGGWNEAICKIQGESRIWFSSKILIVTYLLYNVLAKVSWP